MAKRRTKKRTHTRADQVPRAPGRPGGGNRTPKSMVIRMGAGEIGPSVSHLAKDVRAMMEPDTASRLKERRANKLKDYLSMAGPLGVTHLYLFSRSDSGNTNLRVALTPRGPTLHFRVERYSLCKDVAKAQKYPRAGGKEYQTAPLLVMNNMKSSQGSTLEPIQKQLEDLTTTVFQNMFPQISPLSTRLSAIRRIMLLNRDVSHAEEGKFIFNLRHYAITTKRTDISRRISRLDPRAQRHREHKRTAVPNLSKLTDMSQYLLDGEAGGFSTGGETDLDTDAEVEIREKQTRRVVGKNEAQKFRYSERRSEDHTDVAEKVEKRAVKLVELGPRMELRLVKVEEGICEGKVMWNEFITKSKADEKRLDQSWDQRRKEKEERKKQQKENVEKKKRLEANTNANANGNTVQAEDRENGWTSDDSFVDDTDIEDDVDGDE